jgi:prepilin-type N-terminal cleavage/methylation domain-containing protein
MNRENVIAYGRGQAGFTLAEMLVSLAVTVILLLGILATFDLNGRVARVQTNVADMQQSLRIAQDDVVRLVRMSGRGGLPLTDSPSSLLPSGPALTVRDNVPANQYMIAGETKTRILQGTDVLTVRGVFTTLFQVNASGAFSMKVGDPTGKVVVQDVTPGGVKQDLKPLIDASGKREAILLVSTLGDEVHAVVELMSVKSSAHDVTLEFQVTGDLADSYKKLSSGGSFPSALRNVVYLGILEEYRYYVREDHVVAADASSDLAPKLARARFYPGTDEPYLSDKTNAWMDLADNILDLQIALGFDSSNGGARKDDADSTGTNDEILETANGLNDDWLFNGVGDNAGDAVFQAGPALQYLRVTTLARTDRRDPQYQAPVLPDRLEDHQYPSNDALRSYASRMFRWRTLQTTIDLRNL